MSEGVNFLLIVLVPFMFCLGLLAAMHIRNNYVFHHGYVDVPFECIDAVMQIFDYPEDKVDVDVRQVPAFVWKGKSGKLYIVDGYVRVSKPFYFNSEGKRESSVSFLRSRVERQGLCVTKSGCY
jgi:hypothetical protein